MNRIWKAVIGIYLAILSGIMLWTVIRAFPDGVVIQVNKIAGTLEFVVEIIILSLGVILGLGFVVYQYIKLTREGRCPKQSIVESAESR